MTCVFDVDCLSKLAHWDLLDDAPGALGVSMVSCRTLTSSKYRALKAVSNPDGKVFRAKEAAQRVVDAVAKMVEPLPVQMEVLPQLQDIPEIDAGEAVLLSALTRDKELRLVTGDKRAIRALAKLPLAVRSQFAGRIVILEQVVLALIEKHGIEFVRTRVCPWKDIDMSIANVFGSRCDAPEATVREGLHSYIREVREFCSPPLIRV